MESRRTELNMWCGRVVPDFEGKEADGGCAVRERIKGDS